MMTETLDPATEEMDPPRLAEQLSAQARVKGLTSSTRTARSTG